MYYQTAYAFAWNPTQGFRESIVLSVPIRSTPPCFTVGEELLEALEQAAPVIAMTATATITLRRVLNKSSALDLLRKQPSARSGFRPTIRSRRERNTAAWGGQLGCAWSGPVGQR